MRFEHLESRQMLTTITAALLADINQHEIGFEIGGEFVNHRLAYAEIYVDYVQEHSDKFYIRVFEDWSVGGDFDEYRDLIKVHDPASGKTEILYDPGPNGYATVHPVNDTLLVQDSDVGIFVVQEDGLLPVVEGETQALAAVRDSFYYTVRIEAATELWTSDTTGKNALIATLPSARVYSLTSVHDSAFFLVDGELWKSDGTTIGTEPVQAAQDANSGEISWLNATKQHLYFQFENDDDTHSLMRFDAETHELSLVDAKTGRGSQTTNESGVFYSSDSANEDWEVRYLDDSSDEPSIVVSVPAPNGWTIVAGHVAVSSSPDLLHAVDGSTVELTRPGSGSGYWLSDSDNLYYVEQFFPWHGLHNEVRTWRQDITPRFDSMPTMMPIAPAEYSFQSNPSVGSSPSFGQYGVELNGAQIFVACDNQQVACANDSIGNIVGGGLWRTDGTAEGTFLVKDFGPQVEPNVYGSFVKLGDAVLFTASTAEDGWAIYRTDGTEAGTELVTLLPISRPFYYFDRGLSLLGNKVLFQYRTKMGLTDGTAEGTQFFDADIPHPQLSLDGRLIAVNGQQIVITDGTSEGTEVLADGNSLTSLNDTAYFLSDWRVWSTDGSQEGTQDLGLDTTGISWLARVANVLVIGTVDETWISDGTRDGTWRVSEVVPDASIAGQKPIAFDNRFLFSGSESLWISDGTAAGSTMIGAFAGRFRELGTLGDSLVFVVDKGVSEAGEYSAELWITDGTASGTHMLQTVSQDNGFDVAFVGTVGNTLLFSYGHEFLLPSDLLMTDGTIEGTGTLLSDVIIRNTIGETPHGLVVRIDDGEHGLEPWLLSVQDEVPSGILGDADRNGEVSFADFLVLSQNFGKQVDAVWEDGDFNADGEVSFADFLILSDNFGQTA